MPIGISDTTVGDQPKATQESSTTEISDAVLPENDDVLAQRAMAEYSRQRSERMATCLERESYPQLRAVLDYEEEVGIDVRILYPSLEDPLLDFVPASSEHIIDGYQYPSIPEALLRYDNEAFESQLRRCRSAAENEIGESAVVELTAILDEAYAELGSIHGSEHFELLVDQWIECIESNSEFRVKDIDTLWDGDVLGAFGLQSGEWIADDEIVYPDPPKSGEVRVDLPPPGYRYKPSDGELELAEVDVTCKTATPLLGAVYDARDLVVERTLVQHGSRIEMLREQLEEALVD